MTVEFVTLEQLKAKLRLPTDTPDRDEDLLISAVAAANRAVQDTTGRADDDDVLTTYAADLHLAALTVAIARFKTPDAPHGLMNVGNEFGPVRVNPSQLAAVMHLIGPACSIAASNTFGV